MNLKPLNDRVVVRREAAESKSFGGIILPESSQKKPQRGTVIAVGPGKRDKKTGEPMPMQLKEGDSVLFTSWAGDEVKTGKAADGKPGELLIMHEEDVLAVVG
jgi:chaperonin GroES